MKRYMKRYIISGIFLLLLLYDANSQVLSVKDHHTLKPIENASIYSVNPNMRLTTNRKGEADITQFKNSDSIYIQCLGYKTELTTYSALAEANFAIMMQELGVTLNEIIVSASHWEQIKREVPNRIAVIKPRDAAFRNPISTADMLSQTGEVYVQKSQFGGGSPMIRGFAANRVLITVDGVRMNNAIFRSGNLQNIISIDPFSLEGSEVIFGPGSVVYGSDAIGGVMDFHTLKPALTGDDAGGRSTGSAAFRYSSACAEQTGHLDISFSDKSWGVLSSFSYNNFGDLRMGSDGPDEYLRKDYAIRIYNKDSVVQNADPQIQIPTGYSQLNFMQKIRFKPTDSWDLNYGLHYSKTSNYSRYDRLIERKGSGLRDGEWFYGPQKWMMNSLSIEHKSESSFFNKAKLTAAYQNFEESRHNRSFGSSSRTNRYEKVDVLSFNLDFENPVSDASYLYYGAEALFNSVGSTADKGGKSVDTRYPDGSTWNSISAYLSYRNKLTDMLTLQTGLRYNHINSYSEFDTTFFKFPFISAKINTGALNGSLGIAFNPTDEWNFSVNLSSGFRAPNIDDIGKMFESAPGIVVAPNPDLKSEFAYNADLSAARVFDDFLKIDVTGFFTYLSNAMVRRDYKFNGLDSIVYDGVLSRVQAVQNAANAKVWGVQAGFELLLPAGFSISSRVNWQKGEEEFDDGSTAPLRHAAPIYGITRINYKNRGFRAELYGEFNGEIKFADLSPTEREKPHLYAIDSNGNPYSPSWFTLNLKASYNITDYLQFTAGLENILDKRYKYYSSGIAAAGRNFIFALRTYI